MESSEFRKALKSLKLTQRKFAADTGMSISAINEWARGKAKIPPIAAAYVNLRLWLETKPLTS